MTADVRFAELAARDINAVVPWGKLQADVSYYIGSKYLPANFQGNVKDPSRMSREHAVQLLHFWQDRASEDRVPFRFRDTAILKKKDDDVAAIRRAAHTVQKPPGTPQKKKSSKSKGKAVPQATSRIAPAVDGALEGAEWTFQDQGDDEGDMNVTVSRRAVRKPGKAVAAGQAKAKGTGKSKAKAKGRGKAKGNSVSVGTPVPVAKTKATQGTTSDGSGGDMPETSADPGSQPNRPMVIPGIMSRLSPIDFHEDADEDGVFTEWEDQEFLPGYDAVDDNERSQTPYSVGNQGSYFRRQFLLGLTSEKVYQELVYAVTGILVRPSAPAWTNSLTQT